MKKLDFRCLCVLVLIGIGISGCSNPHNHSSAVTSAVPNASSAHDPKPPITPPPAPDPFPMIEQSSTYINAYDRQAYTDGYELNADVTSDNILKFGSPKAYCINEAQIHGGYSLEEKLYYEEGCLTIASSNFEDYLIYKWTENPDVEQPDWLDRLKSTGLAFWSQDPETLYNSKAVGFLGDYVSGECSLWTFNNRKSADKTTANGFFENFGSYFQSTGTDIDTGEGFTAMYLDPDSTCATDMLSALHYKSFSN